VELLTTHTEIAVRSFRRERLWVMLMAVNCEHKWNCGSHNKGFFYQLRMIRTIPIDDSAYTHGNNLTPYTVSAVTASRRHPQ
jgi:hypothetical protein